MHSRLHLAAAQERSLIKVAADNGSRDTKILQYVMVGLRFESEAFGVISAHGDVRFIKLK